MKRGIDLYEAGERLGAQVLSLHKRAGLTAVSLHDDCVAMGLIKDLLRRGVQVPDDISVIGYDNIEASAFALVPLTTYAPPTREMVDAALDAILEGRKIPNNLMLNGRLVVRDSVRRLETGRTGSRRTAGRHMHK